MYRVNGQLEFSPLDLTRHMESPFGSWMERFALQFPAAGTAPRRYLID